MDKVLTTDCDCMFLLQPSESKCDFIMYLILENKIKIYESGQLKDIKKSLKSGEVILTDMQDYCREDNHHLPKIKGKKSMIIYLNNKVIYQFDLNELNDRMFQQLKREMHDVSF